jgi:hypothetical protein
MVLILPEGFELAPPDRIPEEMKKKLENLFINHIVLRKKYFSCWSSSWKKI